MKQATSLEPKGCLEISAEVGFFTMAGLSEELGEELHRP